MNSQKETHKQRRILTIIKCLMGELYDGTKPVVPITVGPHNPSGFDKFFDQRDTILDALERRLGAFNSDEIDLRFDMFGNKLNSELIDDGQNFYFESEIRDLRKNLPNWYAAGFGHPNFVADFVYWGEMPHYSRSEAICLSLGVEPEHFSKHHLTVFRDTSKERKMSPQIEFLLRREEQIDRNFPSSKYNDRIKPEEILGWVEAKNVEVHEAFPDMLRVAATPNIYDRHFDGEGNELGSPKRLDHREKVSMAKIITAIAIREYGFEPTARKSPIPKEIQDIAASLGLEVTDDTVRRYLKLGAQYLPKDWKTE